MSPRRTDLAAAVAAAHRRCDGPVDNAPAELFTAGRSPRRPRCIRCGVSATSCEKRAVRLLVSASTALLGGRGPNGAQLTEDVVKGIMRAMFGG
jgi:hypothetical protein